MHVAYHKEAKHAEDTQDRFVVLSHHWMESASLRTRGTPLSGLDINSAIVRMLG